MTNVLKFVVLAQVLAFSVSVYADPVRMPLDILYTTANEDVPEQVHVTHMLDYYGRARMDALIHILEEVPEHWEYIGDGRLSVSEDYSRAGRKSIRWDWKVGDVIRIKDLGVISTAKLMYNVTSGRSKDTAPFELHVFQEKPLPKNTKFNLYLKRAETRGDDLHLVQLHYHMNYGGTWYRMGNNFIPKGNNKIRIPGTHNIDLIDAMPGGIAEPGENELVLRAPTNVASGTFYLDRLIVPATMPSQELVDGGLQKYLNYGYDAKTNKVEYRALPFAGDEFHDVVTVGIPDKPLDPTQVAANSPSFYGYYVEQPLAPDKLTAEQQAYVDQLRDSYFKLREPLKADNPKYKQIEAQAAAILASDCVRQPDGSYRFKESVNFGGENLYFAGDRFSYRKHWLHLPSALIHEPNFKELCDAQSFYRQYDSVYVVRMYSQYADWFVKCPDSEPVDALMKAFLDWMKYQVVNPPVISAGGDFNGAGRHMGGLVEDSRELIAAYRKRGNPDDQPYIEYVGNLASWVGGGRIAAFAVEPEPGISAEFSPEMMYYSLFYEPDDRQFFNMLSAAQRSWANMLTIVDRGGRDMIKPDYTYYHHAHVSYWHGNYHAHIKLGRMVANTLLELPAEVRRNLAWYTTRYTFGPLDMTGNVKAGQESTSGVLRFKHRALSDAAFMKTLDRPEPFQPEEWPSRDVLNYFYEMNWDEVPSARKYLAGVLGISTQHPQADRNAFLEKYPKLASIQPQPDIHLSTNWTGATSYSTGLARVYIGSYNDKDSTPSRPHGRWSWNRGYGCLYIVENERVYGRPPLGASVDGYVWSKAPGATIPAVTDEEYLKYHTIDGKPELNPNGVELASRGGRGNGSLTFNETEEAFGKYGNYSFQTLREENQKIWKLFDIDGVEGKKSYHIFQDRIVCLGSDYHANSARPMETILFQEATETEGAYWNSKNPRRWNPDKLELSVNGQRFGKAFRREVPLTQGSYVIAPYGHAWIIPGGQQGKLRIEWKQRTTPLVYRLGVGSSLKPGKEMTTGSTAIAWLDHGSSRQVSSHHYCLLLNRDGKSPEELEAHAQATLKNPRYNVLRHDKLAHAVVFDGGNAESDVYSYIVYAGDQTLDLPYVTSVNKRLNLMMQQNADGDLVLSVADPLVDLEKDSKLSTHGYSKDRQIKVRFTDGLKVKLLSSTSGLPQTNPPLNASIKGNELTYTTRNGVTDTFVVVVGE